MISAQEMKTAYEAIIDAAQDYQEAEETRIAKADEREEAYQKAADEARLDGITDEGKVHNKALKGSRKQLTALHLAEKKSRLAKNALQIAGMQVDSLVRQQEAYKQAAQK
jgi:hypothetical protein